MSLTQLNKRSAIRAGNWLGMEAPVERIDIFRPAILTHGKFFHRCVWAVIWNILDDGETRSAVGAADEGIQITPVVWVEQFPLTLRANSDIAGKRLIRAVHILRLAYLECCRNRGGCFIYFQRID